jgi:hypothetical protein
LHGGFLIVAVEGVPKARWHGKSELDDLICGARRFHCTQGPGPRLREERTGAPLPCLGNSRMADLDIEQSLVDSLFGSLPQSVLSDLQDVARVKELVGARNLIRKLHAASSYSEGNN